jgi:DNA-binding IclR family transcriptional regulator
MTKFARMLDVLDLYSETVTLLTAEEIAARLAISRPTAFRYVGELSGAGFLANYSGRYSLGPRLITLDYRIRASDPMLKEARAPMRMLSAETACTSILCRMYNHEIINVHHEAGYGDNALVFVDRGQPLPLFRGAASKIMLAFMPSARLKRLYQQHPTHPDVRAIARDWPGFQVYFAAIRQRGHYVSNEEVSAGIAGIAAPIHIPKLGAVGVVSLVLSLDRLALVNADSLASILKTRNGEIASRLRLLDQAQ